MTGKVYPLKTRPYQAEDRIACLHTALSPLKVAVRPDGFAMATTLECGNCHAILVMPRSFRANRS